MRGVGDQGPPSAGYKCMVYDSNRHTPQTCDGSHCEFQCDSELVYLQFQERLQRHRCSFGAALNERPPYWVCTSKSVDRRSTQTLGRYLPPWIQESVRRKLTPYMPAPSR